MRCLIPVLLAVLLSATSSDAACVPTIADPAGGTVTITGIATGTATVSWVDIFFMPAASTGTVAFAVDSLGVQTYSFGATADATSARIAGGGGTAWDFTADITAASTTTSLAMGGGVMKSDTSAMILNAQTHFFSMATASTYLIKNIAGKASTACVPNAAGGSAEFTLAYGTVFTSAAETQLLTAVRGCEYLSTVDVATPFAVATVVGTGTAGNADGFGTAATLTTPSGLAQWRDRYFVQSNGATGRISAVFPAHNWQLAVVSAGGTASTADVAFTALNLATTNQGKAAGMNTWNNCWLSVHADATVNAFLVDPAANLAYHVAGTFPANGEFQKLDPNGVSWLASGTTLLKKDVTYPGCAAVNAVPSAHACKWPTATATTPLPKTRTPTMPLPKTRTMTYVAPPTTVAATSAATSAAATATTVAVTTAAVTTVAATTTVAAAATTTTVAATTAAATTTAAAASSTTTTAAASGSGASAVTCAVLSVMTFLACLI